jgi:DNA-binding transcriptional regulator LsrR (DeoR family)
MALPRDRALLVKAARMYYEAELSQDQIAAEIGVSRSNVSRMLTDARSQGIVQIKIVEHAMRDSILEARLLEILPIKHIRVARNIDGIDETAAVGMLAAEALSERLKPNATVAISWGTTLQAMVNALEPEYLPGVKLVPMVGGMTALSSSSSGDDLIRVMATKLSATYQNVLAPAVVSSAEVRNAFSAEPTVQAVLETAAEADIAVVGIGSARSSSTMELLHGAGLPESTQNSLLHEMAGDIAARFYSIDGQEVDHGWNDRIIGVQLAQLRRIPFVIGAAAGSAKATAVIGAIHGGLINEAVISSSTALAIVRHLDAIEGAQAS